MQHFNHSFSVHSKMNDSAKPSMGKAGHNHHQMMITDFKKRFYVSLPIT
jgi:Cu2+-exporting ATPase